MKISFVALTDVGLVRENNEDNYLYLDVSGGEPCLPPPHLSDGVAETNGGGVLFAVADGMGGALAGEVASRMAVEALAHAAKTLLEEDDEETARKRILESIRDVNTEIFDAALENPKHHGMGTTLTVAYLRDGKIQFFQVGDSKGYVARKSVISPEDAEQLEGGKNIILQALGAEATVKIDYSEATLGGGDTVLLCTDGLHGCFKRTELEERVLAKSDVRELGKSLIQEARDRGGPDNITAVLVTVSGSEAPPEPPSLLKRISGLLKRKK
jgi:protein phosphatase